MVHPRDKLAQALARASDPRTSPDELTRLAGHDAPEVRLAVAANGSTPRAVIDAMMASTGTAREERAVVQAVMGNPGLPLWLLEDPGWLRRQGWSAAVSMARSPSLTLAGWEALLGHEADRIHAALLSSPVAPADAWQRCGLASELDALHERLDGAEDEREEQALAVLFLAHPGLATRLRDEPEWLRHGRDVAARALAASPALTRELWEALRGHPDERTRLALLRSPLAPPDAWTVLGLPTAGAWDLSEAGVGDVELLDLAQRPQLAGLTALSVWSDEEAGLIALLRSPFLAGLTSLALPLLGLSAGVVAALGTTTSRGHLACLELPGCELGKLPPEALAALAGLDALASLDLSRNELSVDHLESLVSSGALARVTRLDVSKNQLTPDCMDSLGRWASRARPTSLSLAENPLGDDGVTALASSASFASLTSLVLAFTGMGPAGASSLVLSTALPRLRELVLDEEAMSAEAMAVLDRASFRPVGAHERGHLFRRDMPG